MESAKTEMSIVCWGEVLWDLFPDGRHLGGAPANVAYHLACLGEQPTLISRVGKDDLGREARARLLESGVNTRAVQTDPTRPTGSVRVELRGGEPRYSLSEHSALDRIEFDTEANAAVGAADAICFGTLTQRDPHGREGLETALEHLTPECLRICDPNLRPWHVDDDLLAFSFRAADVVKINETEEHEICRRFGTSDAISWLLEEMSVKLVALTRGEHGSILRSREETSAHEGAVATPGGDNVGAGDSFVAMLIHLYLRDAPLATINHAANEYAAYVASHRGATPSITADQLQRMLTPR